MNIMSCDLMLGVPFNIASYALLLLLLCQTANLQPGNLAGTLCDCHIYVNQIEAAKHQLSRSPSRLPKVEVNVYNIFDWTHQDVCLLDYNSQEKIDFGEVAV